MTKLKGICESLRGHVPLKLQIKQEKADIVIDTTHIRVDMTDRFLQDVAVLPGARARISYRLRPVSTEAGGPPP